MASLSRTDTLMLMSVKVSSMDNIPNSLVIPSSNLKLNETVGQGKNVYKIRTLGPPSRQRMQMQGVYLKFGFRDNFG